MIDKSIILVVDTSTKFKRFLIFRGQVLEHSAEFLTKFDIATTFSEEINKSFQKLKIDFCDIAALAVNVGPGALSSTRCGVTFINAIGFASAIPIIKYSHMEVIGAQSWAEDQVPALTLQNIADEKYIYGIFIDGRFDLIGIAKADEITKEMKTKYGQIVLATHLEKIDKFLNNDIARSTVKFASIEGIHRLVRERWEQKQFSSRLAVPLNENNLEIIL